MDYQQKGSELHHIYLPGGDPQPLFVLLFVQVAATAWCGAEKLVCKHASTCIEQQFALLPIKFEDSTGICWRYVCMIGFDFYV